MVAAWDDGENGTRYFDPNSRVLLAREATDAVPRYARVIGQWRPAGTHTAPLTGVMRRVRFDRAVVRVPDHLRLTGLDVVVDEDGRFYAAHPDTGERDGLGWVAGAPGSSAAWLRVGDTAGPLVGDDEEERLVEFAKWKPIRLGDLRPHANFRGVRLLRVNHRIGQAAFLDPQTSEVCRLLKTTRLEPVDADFSVRPPMRVVVSAGGSIAHPDQRAGRSMWRMIGSVPR